MHRRTLCAMIAGGALGTAGCLEAGTSAVEGDDTSEKSPRSSSQGDSSNGTDGGSSDSSGDAVECPDTDLTPPADLDDEAAVESFVVTFEEAYRTDVDSPVGLDHVRAEVSARRFESDGVRIDLSVFLSMSGWEGSVRLVPVDEARSDGTEIDEGELEVVPASEPPIVTDERVQDALETVLEENRTETITDESSFETLLEAGLTDRAYLFEYDGERVYVESTVDQWIGHGSGFAGYLFTPESVSRSAWGAPETNADDEPRDVPAEAWERLECWI